MKKRLTERQLQYYIIINGYILHNHKMPNSGQIVDLMQTNSRSSAQEMVMKIKNKGYEFLEKDLKENATDEYIRLMDEAIKIIIEDDLRKE